MSLDNAGIKQVTVIGAGLMGHGIGLEFAAFGMDVTLVDRDEGALEAARGRVRAGLHLLTEAGRVSEEQQEAVLRRIEFTTDLTAACRGAELVIEAVFEDLSLKRRLLSEAAASAPAHAIFSSNTSSFPPSTLADAVGDPGRFAITHYFNPPYLVPLVEIVPGLPGGRDSSGTSERLRTLYASMGKRPVVLEKEITGFVANRLQSALNREASALVEAGIATVRDVDSVVRYGLGRRLAVAGPFEVWEQVGWDLVGVVAGELFKDISTASEPSRLMVEAVGRGDLGVKSGRGMYDWTPAAAESLRLRVGRALVDLARLEQGGYADGGEGAQGPPERLIDDQKVLPAGAEKKKIAVIGAGLMGHGIALEFAANGHDVAINDLNEELLDSALTRCEESLNLLAKNGMLAHDAVPGALSRISATADLREAASDADVVIEAVSEDLRLKQRIFAELDTICAPGAILLSNSSTYPPSAVGAEAERRERIGVAHYFNPPHLLPIVEVVKGPETSQQTVEQVVELLESVGKRPAVVQREVPGFIGNRLQVAMFREALHLVSAGVATAQQVDEVVRSSFGRRLAVAGVFELRELVGLDLALDISRQIIPTLGNSKELPAVLRDLIDAGDLGTKSGRGFYSWTPESAEALRLRIGTALAEMASWPDSP